MQVIPKLTKAIAIFQILCAAIGLRVIISFANTSINQPAHFFPTIFLIFFIVLSFSAGVGLMKGYRWSYYLSALVQLSQILFIALPTFSYFFAWGVWLNIGLFSPFIIFNLKTGALFNFSPLPGVPFGIGVNIVATSIFLYLLKFIFNNSQEQEKISEIDV